MNNHDHSQCLVSESGHIQCDGPTIQKRDEEASLRMQKTRRSFARDNGATLHAADKFAKLSQEPPTIKEFCDFLIAHFNR